MDKMVNEVKRHQLNAKWIGKKWCMDYNTTIFVSPITFVVYEWIIGKYESDR